MNATSPLSFRTIKTPNIPEGPLHLMRVTKDDGTTTDYRLFPGRPSGVKWAGPVYRAANGSQFRIGRCNSGALIAWKTVRISEKFGQESYRMRSVPGGYKGDYVKCWSRNIGGKTFDFSRIYWNAGQDGSVLRVRRLGEMVHEFASKTPVKMK